MLSAVCHPRTAARWLAADCSSPSRPGRLPLIVAAIAIAGLGIAPRASAANRIWICPADYFDNPTCWTTSTTSLPGPLDNVYFSSSGGGSRTVYWDDLVLTNWDNTFPTSPVTVANLSINNLTAVNLQSLATSYTSDAHRTFNITGNVAIESGSLSFNPSVASNPNLIMTVGGTITVSNNSTLDTTGGAIVRSSGALSLQSGGDAYTHWGAVDTGGVLFASNMMTVNGAQVGGTGSLWDVNTLIVGRNGSGNLGITAGGTVDAAFNGFVGEFAGSSGAITVGGTNARLQIGGGLYLGGNDVGSGGAGSLVVNSGGLATIGGQLRLWNGGSSINTTGGGQVHAGTLVIQNGADVDSSLGAIGTDYGYGGQVRAASTATVTGVGSTWEMVNLYQLGGAGILNVTAGGALTASSTTYVGYDVGANQQLNINAATATLATSGFTYVGYGNGGAAQGAVNVTNGGTLTTGTAYLGYNSTGTGLITVGGGAGTSTWNASAIRVGGLASTSNATGTLTVNSGGRVNVSGPLDVWGANGSVNTTAGGIVRSTGALNLQNGGDAYTDWGAVDTGGVIFASNMMTVNGAQVGGTGSLWDVNTLIVGRNGSGSLGITAGGTTDAAFSGFVGEFAGSSGAITVGGTNARLQVGGGLYLGGNNVGSGGAGSLVANTGGVATIGGELRLWNGSSSINTTGGGRVSANTLTIQGGADVDSSIGATGTDYGLAGQVRAASTATVTGAGSTWDMERLLQIGGTGTVNVTAGGALTATIDARIGTDVGANQQLNINAASATLATALTTYVGFGNGGAAQGAVNVTNGGTLTTGFAYLGFFSPGTGLATVGGGAGTSTWNASGLYVGGSTSTSNATGTLTVNSGGAVTVSGQMDVWGNNGSVNTTAGGRVSANTLIIQSGADVDSVVGAIGTDSGFLGQVRAASTATVSGMGSTWDMDRLSQLGGTGTLNVTAGGALTATTEARIGQDVGANQQLNINAASVTLAPSFFTYVGFGNGGAAQGAVNVTNGGTLTTGIAQLGFFSTGTGLATVGGGAGTSTWNASAIRVGGASSTSNATGTLTVNSGGVVDVSGQLDVWGANGSVNLAGGTLLAATLSNLGTIQFTANSLLDGALSNQDQVTVATGVTATFGGTVDHTGLVDLGAGSTAIFEALVSGDGDFTGTGTAVFEGGFSPGNSPGLVSFGGDVALAAANILTMELGGTARGTGYDAIDVADTITLAGILEIALYGGFDAPAFSTYDLIRAENLSGVFSSYLLPGGPQHWMVEYLQDAEGSTDILRVTAVPVPGAVWLLGAALGALGWARRRQRLH